MMSHAKNTVIRRASSDTSNTKTIIMFVERLLLLSDCECEKGFMKLLKTMVCAFLCTTALSGCASKKNRELNIWVITDLHYLAENLFRKEASSFQKILESSGGKMIEYMPEIMREFKEKAIAEHPDAILVPGDITFNGEYESMEELKPYFHSIQSEGIPVTILMQGALPGMECLVYVILRRQSSQIKWVYLDMSRHCHMRRIPLVIPMPWQMTCGLWQLTQILKRLLEL